MTKAANISFKNFLKLGLSVLLILGFTAVLLAASSRQSAGPLKGFRVRLNNENENSFLRKKDIRSWVFQNLERPLSLQSLDKVDLQALESLAESHPWVANAEVYVDNRGLLQLDITQRTPLARVFSADGSSFYMDETRKKMPVGIGYSFPVPVFTRVTLPRNDSLRRALEDKMVFLSRVIQEDSFWQAQIEQIVVRPDHTFVLIPLLGRQKIMLGDTSRLREKLFNLFAYYQQVPQKIGWDAYKVLDLRFAGQIVASPALDAPLPVEKAQPPDPPAAALPPAAGRRPPDKSIKSPVRQHIQRPAADQQNKKEKKPKYIYSGN